jgi:hypothetical protein
MIHGNVPPLHQLRPFPLIAGLMAHWYDRSAVEVGTNNFFALIADEISWNYMSSLIVHRNISCK